MTEARRPPSMATLMLLIGIPPFATDTYLAAMPAMGASLTASPATIQLTLTGFLLGVAAGQLILGPLSDGIGRRPFLLAGTITFVVLSGLCALAPPGPLLVAAPAGARRRPLAACRPPRPPPPPPPAPAPPPRGGGAAPPRGGGDRVRQGRD